MKYIYAYKTSGGTRYEASMEAPSRDDVFSSLRKQGIKPIKVVAEDGSKANGERRGVRRRVVAGLAVAVAVLAGVAVYIGRGSSAGGGAAPGGKTYEARPIERQAIPGDRAKVVRSGTEAFGNRAEQFLARFAEPGRMFIAPECDWPKKAEFEAVLNAPVMVRENDFTETVDMKRIVAGIKREMSDYLKGGGLVSGYIRELIKRQQTEIKQREDIEKRLGEMLAPPSVGMSTDAGQVLDNQQKSAYEFWLRANAQLQSLGIYAIPLPDKLRHYQLSHGLED